jgi:hypothetical protein
MVFLPCAKTVASIWTCLARVYLFTTLIKSEYFGIYRTQVGAFQPTKTAFLPVFIGEKPAVNKSRTRVNMLSSHEVADFHKNYSSDHRPFRHFAR